MNLRILSPLQGGVVDAIASKSHVHRLLICAALSDRPAEIECSALSDDIEATVDCLRALGAEIGYNRGVFSVAPVKEIARGKVLRCRESGSTLRFLLPVAAALGADCRFLLDGRLSERPLQPLIAALEQHGCSVFRPESRCISISGQLRSGEFFLPGNLSSQFISGLLLAFSCMKEGGSICLQDRLESAPYVRLTVETLKAFGVDVHISESRFAVPFGSVLHSPGRIAAEGDWSNAAFWLCAGAISRHPVLCRGLSADSVQGDRQVLAILAQMGARAAWTKEGALVEKDRLHAVDIDAADIPDLIPALAAVCALAEGRSRIYHAGRLRLKESDRLHTICSALGAVGAEIREEPEGLTIRGVSQLAGGTVCAAGDHRIAMMAAVVAAGCAEPVTVLQAQAAQKSYPDFWKHYQLLGGKTEVL